MDDRRCFAGQTLPDVLAAAAGEKQQRGQNQGCGLSGPAP